jgi:hypothetical protein
MLPYPGRNESYISWSNRCDEWESDRARWNRSRGGLSGKPKKHGYQVTFDGDTFAYNPGPNCDGNTVCASLVIGKLKPDQRVKVVRYGYGSKYANLAENFARANGLGFVCVKLGQGMTARFDGVAYEIGEILDEVYSSDEH